MIDKISESLRSLVTNFSMDDKIIFKNQLIPISQNNFAPIIESTQKTVTYIDGGQAQVLSAGNFCLSFIRVAGITFKGIVKQSLVLNEFYILTSAKTINGELFYVSKLFPIKGDPLIFEDTLLISSMDASIRTGKERAAISSVANMARRFSELNLAYNLSQKNHSDLYCLDGTKDSTFAKENLLIERLPDSVCALAKTSTLFTEQGNNPAMVLSHYGPSNIWSYHAHKNTYFVKLHEKAKHIFRFEGNKDAISELIILAKDPLFLGYPYGLILVDQLARVSNKEKDMLRVQFLMNNDNKLVANYLRTTNAHEILDTLS